MNTYLGIKNKKIFVSLLRKAKRKQYKDLNIADVADNKKFSERVQPFFGNKIKGNTYIGLVEGNESH